jgi:glycosyltransferase involved in cell wall biosynthesis
MNVLIISSANPNKTAGIVGKDLLKSLQLGEGIRVKLLVREYDVYSEPNIIPLNSKLDHVLIRAKKYLKYVCNKFLLAGKSIIKDPDYSMHVLDLSKNYYNPHKILKKINFNPDVIVVLFIAEFLNFQNLYYLQKRTNAKMYMYLMDMALFTGGCHYAWNCKGYFKNCGMCPAIYSKDPLDQTYLNMEYKRHYISKMNFELIIPSEELNRQVYHSSLFKDKKLNSSFFIPIDETIYKPGEKTVIRKKMKLPLLKKIILFGASHSINRRKGFKELIITLKLLYQKLSDENKNKVHLLIAGDIDDKLLRSIPFGYTSLGFLNHHNLVNAFQASDIFASFSIEESGPMMVNQSLMCGTPVVAFEVGVALDLVQTKITGYQARLNDCEDFANGLLYLLQLNSEQTESISMNCRVLALSNFSLKETSSKWMKLLQIN